jgi:hypothetical protein
MLVGYGIPTVVVIVAVAGWGDGYGETSAGVCWLSTDGDRLIWAFVGPACVIMALNAYFLFSVIRAILNMPSAPQGGRSSAKNGARRASAVRGAKASVSFAILMGFSWIFGILVIDVRANRTKTLMIMSGHIVRAALPM